MKAEEIFSFFQKKEKICESVEYCYDCPITDSGARCAYGSLTLNQIETILNWNDDVDWGKIPVDTMVIVWNNPKYKYKRYFAKYMNGKIYTFDAGATSWSHEPDTLMEWLHGELVEDEYDQN